MKTFAAVDRLGQAFSLLDLCRESRAAENLSTGVCCGTPVAYATRYSTVRLACGDLVDYDNWVAREAGPADAVVLCNLFSRSYYEARGRQKRDTRDYPNVDRYTAGRFTDRVAVRYDRIFILEAGPLDLDPIYDHYLYDREQLFVLVN